MTHPTAGADGRAGSQFGAEPTAAGLAGAVFGDRLGLAQRFAALLAGDGVAHGHIGPRELPRLWERHLLNCAAVTELLPARGRVIDVGSGAGLPGLVMAIRRPDLGVILLEPMQRRTEFLQRCVDELGLGEQVSVVRGRADDREVRRGIAPVEWVTARAVAPLDRLVTWCSPLLAEQGTLLAMKGQRAAEELEGASGAIRDAGFGPGSVRSITMGNDVCRVVVLERLAAGSRKPHRARDRGGR